MNKTIGIVGVALLMQLLLTAATGQTVEKLSKGIDYTSWDGRFAAPDSAPIRLISTGAVIDRSNNKGFFGVANAFNLSTSDYVARHGQHVVVNVDDLTGRAGLVSCGVQTNDLIVPSFEYATGVSEKQWSESVTTYRAGLSINGTPTRIPTTRSVEFKQNVTQWMPLSTFEWSDMAGRTFRSATLPAKSGQLRYKVFSKTASSVKYSVVCNSSNFYVDFDPETGIDRASSNWSMDGNAQDTGVFPQHLFASAGTPTFPSIVPTMGNGNPLGTQSVLYDGSDGHINDTSGSYAQFETVNYSVSMWINASTFPGAGNARPIDLSRAATPEDMRGYMWRSSVCASADACDLSWFVLDSGGSTHFVDFGRDPAGTDFATNTWYHVVVAFRDDTDNMTAYVDGVEVTTVDVGAFTPLGSAANKVALGYRGVSASEFFDGSIAGMRWYNRSITAVEANNLSFCNEVLCDTPGGPPAAVPPTNLSISVPISGSTVVGAPDFNASLQYLTNNTGNYSMTYFVAFDGIFDHSALENSTYNFSTLGVHNISVWGFNGSIYTNNYTVVVTFATLTPANVTITDITYNVTAVNFSLGAANWQGIDFNITHMSALNSTDTDSESSFLSTFLLGTFTRSTAESWCLNTDRCTGSIAAPVGSGKAGTNETRFWTFNRTGADGLIFEIEHDVKLANFSTGSTGIMAGMDHNETHVLSGYNNGLLQIWNVSSENNRRITKNVTYENYRFSAITWNNDTKRWFAVENTSMTVLELDTNLNFTEKGFNLTGVGGDPTGLEYEDNVMYVLFNDEDLLVQFNNLEVLLGTVNLTILDELTRDVINNSFSISLFGPDAYNFSTTSGSSVLANVTAGEYQVQYFSTPDYSLRERIIFVSNQSFNQENLFAITDGNSTSLIVTVKDQNFRSVENARVQALRRYTEPDAFEVVAELLSSFDGSGSFRLQQDNGIYKFRVLVDNLSVLTTIGTVINTEHVANGLNFQVNTEVDDLAIVNTLLGVQSTLSWTSSQNMFTLDTVDVSGKLDEVCLNVYQIEGGSLVLRNDSCSTSSSSTLQISVRNDSDYQYLAESVISSAGTSYKNNEISAVTDFENVVDKFGSQGILMLAYLLIALVGALAFDPRFVLIGVGLSVVLPLFAGLTVFTLTTAMMILGGSIILSTVIDTRKT